MTTNDLNRPIEVGEILSRGWNLYRQNFSQYCLIALKAYLWIFVPTVIATVSSSLAPQLTRLPSRYAGWVVLVSVVFAVGYIICAARYLGWITGISRLVYQALREEEDERAALRFTRSRQYSLLWENVLRVLIFLIALIAFSLAIGVVIATSGITGEMLARPEQISPAIVGRIVLVSLPVSLIFLVFFSWLGLRTMLADQALAIEQDSGAVASIGRSWKLVQGSALRSFFIVFVTYLFILPVSFALSIVGQVLSGVLFSAALPDEAIVTSFADALPYFGIAIVSTVFSTLAGVVTLPLWHTVATTLYVRLAEKLVGQGNAIALD